MARRKRRTPEAVREQLERKRRLSATMAERQGAALGREARERLKPLAKAAAQVAAENVLIGSLRELSSAFNDVTIAFPPLPSFPQSFLNPFPSLVVRDFSFGEPERPTIDAGKLAALKGAEPRKVPARVPDLVEVITGWRGWELSKSGRLEALGNNTLWPAKQAIEAECHAGNRHFAPSWDCSCGIWAFKDVDRLVAAIGTNYRRVSVIGPVSLWGRVIETENGYRAQYAYPSELWLLDETLEELGHIYDVPVRMVRDSQS